MGLTYHDIARIACSFISEKDPATWGRNISELSEHDINRLVNFLKSYNLIPLFYHLSNKHSEFLQIPEQYKRMFRGEYLLASSDYLIWNNQLKKILKEFEETGIETILLKGVHVSEAYYDNPATRVMCDIDLLIHYKDIEKVIPPLENIGYSHNFHYNKNANIFLIKHLPGFFNNKGCCLNIHWTIHNRYLDFEHKINIDTFWNDAVKTNLYGVVCHIMGTEDLILYLSINIAEDLFENKILQLYDIACVINKQPVDWELLVKKAHQMKAERPVYWALHLVNRYFGAAPPLFVLDQIKPSGCIQSTEQLIEDMLFAYEIPRYKTSADSRFNTRWKYILYRCFSRQLIAYKYGINVKSSKIYYYAFIRMLGFLASMICYIPLTYWNNKKH